MKLSGLAESRAGEAWLGESPEVSAAVSMVTEAGFAAWKCLGRVIEQLFRDG